MAQPGLNRKEVSHYTVNIGALTGGVAPDDGHVDFTTPEEYAVASAFPTTKVLSLAKERANMRWEAIIRQLGSEIHPLQISGAVATTADEDTEATVVDFTIAYDRIEYLRTEDTENNPGIFLEGEAAIKRWVERALITDHTFLRSVYNPADTGLDAGPPADTAAQVKGMNIESVTAGAVEASAPIATVTVTAVPKVTDTI